MTTTISPATTRIGWIGTGVMGSGMCQQLLARGYRVTLHTRTRSKAKALLAAGAEWAATPREVAQNSEVVASIVGYPEQVRQVMLGPDGVVAALAPGGFVIDFTTSTPSLARELYEAARTRHIFSLDAPVSGGDIGAREARLSIMVGGELAAFQALEPVWQALGTRYVHQGPAGSGQHTKLVNQILIASGMVGVCEALVYGYRAGLDLERVLESVSAGAAGSWSLSNYAPKMLAGRFEPGFFVEHFIKDMAIALEESRRLGLALPGLALAEQLYRALAAQGHATAGVHALVLATSSLSGLDWQEQVVGKEPRQP